MYVMNKLFDIVLVQYFKLTGYIYIYKSLSNNVYVCELYPFCIIHVDSIFLN